MSRSAASVPRRTLPTGGWEHAQVAVERDGRITRDDRRLAARPGQRDDVRADAGRSVRRADRARDDPARRHRHRQAGHRHVRQPVAGRRRRGAAPGRREGEEPRWRSSPLHCSKRTRRTSSSRTARSACRAPPASVQVFAEVAAFAYIPVPLPDGLDEPGLSDEAFFEPTNNTYPFGCHISMVEVDRETGEPKLLKLVAVDDAGQSDQPDDRRGSDSRRAGAGHRAGDGRGGCLQRRTVS